MYRHLTNLPMSSTLSTHCSSLPHPPTHQTCTDILLSHPRALNFLPTVPHFLIFQYMKHTDNLLTQPWALNFLPLAIYFMIFQHVKQTNSSLMPSHIWNPKCFSPCYPLPHPSTYQTNISLTNPWAPKLSTHCCPLPHPWSNTSAICRHLTNPHMSPKTFYPLFPSSSPSNISNTETSH